MTLQQNARFTVYRMVEEYNPQNGNLWDIAKMIKHAYEINAIKEHEVRLLGMNAAHLTFDEIMTA